MEAMFILRALDASREVLGWAKIPVESRGDGGLWAKQNFVFEADRSGVITAVNSHWPDVNVNYEANLPEPIRVDEGKVYTVLVTGSPLFTIGSDPRPLPPVTVRTSQVIGISNGR